MSFKNSSEEYGSIAKFFHWTISIAIILMLIIGYFMEDFSQPYHSLATTCHKSLGITILFLAALRLLWKIINPKLSPPTNNAFHNAMAICMHGALYLIMFIMPLSGWVMSTAAGKISNLFWLYPFPMPGIPKNPELAHQAHDIHGYIAYAIVALLLAHIGAAFYHHIIKKDNILARMLPKSKT
jgi:cytochrome b561